MEDEVLLGEVSTVQMISDRRDNTIETVGSRTGRWRIWSDDSIRGVGLSILVFQFLSRTEPSCLAKASHMYSSIPRPFQEFSMVHE